MNLSLFENDGTLGLAYSRTVVLRGSVTVSQLFSPNIFDIKGWIKTALENNGFFVTAVRMSAAGWIGYTNNVEIELEVFNNFTADEARAGAISAIEAATANYGLNTIFANTTLSVVYDAYVPPSASTPPTGSTPSGSRPPVTSPPSVYDQTQSGSGDFLANLGLGAGMTTPIVIGAGVVLLVLMLRK